MELSTTSINELEVTSATPSPPSACAESRHVPLNTDFIVGLVLAISSSAFIGTSFIVKKKGLLKVAVSAGVRAGSGGYGYLREWLWWTGLITMVFGEAANFTAYGFAPAILVTPLGALSVLVSAVLSSHVLGETLNVHGKIGCFLCITGSTVIIVHAPEETDVNNLMDIGRNMISVGFILYTLIAVSVSIYLIFWVAPQHGQTNILIYVAICSLIGSLSVMACKGLSIAIKLTLRGDPQLLNPLAWFFVAAVIGCILVQMNYLNRALDIFNTSLVTPIYYVMFTTLTITASAILFREWSKLTSVDVIGALCGFSTIVCGVFLLHAFKDVSVTLGDLVSLTSRASGVRGKGTVRGEEEERGGGGLSSVGAPLLQMVPLERTGSLDLRGEESDSETPVVQTTR
eukprot:Em0022g517a